jgi:hypothetical protein
MLLAEMVSKFAKHSVEVAVQLAAPAGVPNETSAAIAAAPKILFLNVDVDIALLPQNGGGLLI